MKPAGKSPRSCTGCGPFATPDTTWYAIQSGRGFEQAAAVLGADFAGVVVRDGWAPYRRFTSAIHQTCLAHLLRSCRTLIREHEERHFAPHVQRLLQHALGVRDRYQHGSISAHGLAVARGHLVNQLNALIDRPGAARVARHFAAHLAIEFPAVFTFLLEPDLIDATNWRAEHALRPAVVTRKVCGGNRSAQGAHTHAVLASVLRTLQQRRLDAGPIFSELLRAPRPITALAPTEVKSPAKQRPLLYQSRRPRTAALWCG
jgi:transposase